MLECSNNKHKNVAAALEIKEELENWLSVNNKFKVLITGKMGTGKTTLVRGLKEGYVPSKEKENLLPHTVNVTYYEHTYNGVNFTLIDTPGFYDDIEGSNYLYLTQMVKNEPDILIFTIKMDDEFREEDMHALENVSSAFGWRVWKNALIVLTFANEVRVEGLDYKHVRNRKNYNRKRDDISEKVTDTLLSYRVEEKVAHRIPVIPVGLISEPLIPSDEREISWIEDFWKAIFKVWKTYSEEKDSTDDRVEL